MREQFPNGGNWRDLLRGCIHAAGPSKILGSLIREECTRARDAAQSWRSPDILLKGFRNRQLHGLVDWRLGIELLACMEDPSHVPGASPLYGAWDLGVPSWRDDAARLADQYCAAFDPAARRVGGPAGLEGWLSPGAGGGGPSTLFLAGHPLWKIGAHATDALSLGAMSWAAGLGASNLLVLDTFNLGRRMAWVRGNLRAFQMMPVGVGQMTTPPGQASTDGWMEQLAAMPAGSVMEHGGRRWVRCETQDAWTASPGTWLARRGEEPLFEATVRNIPGAGLKIRANGSNQGFLARDQWSALRVVARRDDQNTGS